MHFYFDGFIWKVSEAGTQRNLGIESEGRRSNSVRAFVHAAKWGGLVAIAAGLFWLETSQPPRSIDDERAWIAAVSDWTPDAPELLMHKGHFALADGDAASAIDAAQRVAKFQPESFDAELLLARSQFAERNFQAASQAAKRAVELAPQSAEANFQWGLASVQLRDYKTAESALQRSLGLNPISADAHLQLGNVFFLTRRLDLAERSYRRALELTPDLTEAQSNLGAVLLQQGHVPEAKQALLAALAGGGNAQCHYNLAVVLLIEGQATEARIHLERAEAMGQSITPEIRRAAGM